MSTDRASARVWLVRLCCILAAGAVPAVLRAQEPDLLPDNFDIRPAFPTDRDPLTVLWNVISRVVVVNVDLTCELLADGEPVYTGICRVGEFNAVEIDALPAGMHTVSVEVDVDDRVGEADEDNNRASLTFPVAAAVVGDVRPGPLRVRPRAPRAGRSVRVQFRVKARGFDRRPRLRCRIVLDGRDQVRAPCRPGARFAARFDGLATGEHLLEAIVDDGDRVRETDEDNNTRATRFTVR